jgi:hypothetical protein
VNEAVIEFGTQVRETDRKSFTLDPPSRVAAGGCTSAISPTGRRLPRANPRSESSDEIDQVSIFEDTLKTYCCSA